MSSKIASLAAFLLLRRQRYMSFFLSVAMKLLAVALMRL